MPGRTPILTAEMEAAFIEAISSGDSIKNSCALAGFSLSTFYLWQQIEREKRTHVKNYRQILQFLESYRVAEAKALHEAVEAVRKAGQGQTVGQRVTTTRKKADGTEEQIVTETFAPGEWRASAWLLERRNPRQWGRRDRTPIDVEKEAERLAKELGIEAEELLEEAELIAQMEG